QLASVRAVETGRRGWLVAAGTAAGVAFSFKPNTGVFGLGAVILSQFLVSRPAAGLIGALLEAVLLAVAAAGVAGALHFEVDNLHFPFLAAPLLVLIAGAAWHRAVARGRGLTRPLGEALADAGSVLVGFVGVAALWLVYYLPQLGLANFLRDVLLIGAGIERIYLLFYPWYTWWSLTVVMMAAIIGVLPWAVERRLVPTAALVGLLGLLALGMLVALIADAYAPEGFAISVVLQFENVSFYLFPLLLAAGVVAWIVRCWSPALPDTAAARTVTITVVY